jgi:hypothetical protein
MRSPLLVDLFDARSRQTKACDRTASVKHMALSTMSSLRLDDELDDDPDDDEDFDEDDEESDGDEDEDEAEGDVETWQVA